MPATAVVGLDCKAYRNTGTYGVPVWNEITIAGDVNLANTKTKVEALRRAKKVKEYLPGARDLAVDFDMIADPGVDDYDALLSAYTGDTLVDFAFLDAAYNSSGARMLRFDAYVFGFSIVEGKEEARMVNVTVAPAYSTSHDVTYSTVT